MADVFISYSSYDQAYVRTLVDALVGAGFGVWYDDKLGVAERWLSVIREQIAACAVFVVVMSPAAEASRWVTRELAYAESLGKPIVPLLLAGHPFWHLLELQHQDVRTGAELPPGFFTRLRRVVVESPPVDPVAAAPSSPEPALLLVLGSHTGPVRSVAYSSDGKYLASGSADRSAILWDARTGGFRRMLEGHRATVFSVAFDPTGERLATASDDATVRIWDVATGQQLHEVTFPAPAVSVAYSPSLPVLAVAFDSPLVRLRHATDGGPYCDLDGHSDWARAVTFTPDGTRLASAGDDGTVRIWRPKPGDAMRVLAGGVGSARAVAFCPNRDELASAGYDGAVRTWDARTGQLMRTFEAHTGMVRSLSYAPDGAYLASAGEDATVRISNVHSGDCRAVLHAQDRFFSIAYSPDGRCLAAGNQDHVVRVWQLP